MEDLISRTALLKTIEDSITQYGGQYTADMLNTLGMVVQIINEQEGWKNEHSSTDGKTDR